MAIDTWRNVLVPNLRRIVQCHIEVELHGLYAAAFVKACDLRRCLGPSFVLVRDCKH